MSPFRASERTRLEECSSEPIRTPGSIQPHGVLLGFDRETRRVTVVSDNSLDFIGLRPDDLLDQTAEQLFSGDRISAMVRAAEGANPTTVTFAGRDFDSIVHRDGPMTFVELEPQIEGFDEREAASSSYTAAQRLSQATELADLLDLATREFAELTGFDRVMVYDFHGDGHGEVVAEQLVEGLEPYLGLHFPASDIPSQARELYLTKISRAIVSTQNPAVPLVARAERDAVDLTHAELRAVSPFHLQFMRNMGQASTVSFSLIHRGALIGMITCAHRTERRLPFIVRRNLEMLANQVAMQMGAKRDLAQLERRTRSTELRTSLLGKIVASDDIAAALLDGQFTVTDVIAADAVAVRLDGVVSRSDSAPGLEALRGLEPLDDIATNSLPADNPQLAAALEGFTGLLLVKIGLEGDFLAFFRREVIQTIDWLGDLSEQNRSQVLSPRVSFSAWRQSVTGISLEWGDGVAAAQQLANDVSSALARREESRLATLAMRDPLTGLANRRALMQQLDAIERGGSLLFLDLDDFKAVNDTYGHDAGDLVILETARRLLDITRAEDRVVRLGGDEFIILSENSDAVAAEALAHRIVEAMREPVGDDQHLVTASIGIVSFEAPAAPSAVIELADAAMYRAKQLGRDGVSF